MHQLFEADGISKKGIKILDFTAAAANLCHALAHLVLSYLAFSFLENESLKIMYDAQREKEL